MGTEGLNYMESVRLVANRIASIYLDQFPRELCYKVEVFGEETGELDFFYMPLSDEMIGKIRECYKISGDLDTEFPEVWDDILMFYSNSLYKLFDATCINSVDIEHPLKFTEFSYYQINKKHQVDCQRSAGISLTDEQFKELLVELLIHKNEYTVNMLAYEKPELAGDVLYKLDNAVYDWKMINTKPTAYDFSELKGICYRILNPFQDILHLFDADDEELRRFALSHQIVPE